MSRHASVVAVSASPTHTLSKPTRPHVELIAHFGIDGDAHAGATVKHRSRMAKDPAQPNLRQVHLVPAEVFDRLAERGFRVGPGEIGENVTTRGVDLLHLPRGARLRLGDHAVVELTGLRSPCKQLEGIAEGLMAALLDRDADGRVVRLAGVMSVVVAGGVVKPGDSITVELPPAPHAPLDVV